ncbi:hypothetical protein ACQEVZ_38620 [Dactylosporangium sp. CA-152071]|uniref:hypothetical protein n=1 Tax=Dactylosporangium sp. CA-152071 TaxID=3239933 RepID=UPI003D90C65D
MSADAWFADYTAGAFLPEVSAAVRAADAVTAAGRHPLWCSGQHPDNWPLHSNEVGGVDMPAYGNAVAVMLLQHSRGNVTVQLSDFRSPDPVRTKMTVDEARHLRDLLDTAIVWAGTR